MVANKEECQTPGAVYRINVGSGMVSCVVYLPPAVTQRGGGTLTGAEHKALESMVHDGMENAISWLWSPERKPPSLR